MRTFWLFLFLCTYSLGVSAQSFREQFTEANLLTEDGYYGLAIPIWLDLLKEKQNANLNYKIGRSYLSLGIDRDRGLPYLLAASKDVKNIYDPFSSDFKTAPVETYFYLGKAYHIQTQIDSAEYFYQKFLDDASKKHYLRSDAVKGLEMCKVARELMANPVDAEIINIGSPINSKFAEYSPIVAFDENTLYFTSRKARADGSNEGKIEAQTGMYYEDMYVSYRSISGNWMEPELLNINVADEHSSVVSMSPDGRRLYIYKIFGGVGNIYESEFTLGTGWSLPELTGSNVNSTSNEFFATVTADDQRLYFVSDRKGGIGGKDIWYAQKLPNGEWGKAINMGEPINTPYDEDAPYFHPDGKTMYFASNGHRSMGGYDVFFSQLDENNVWTNPKNLGYPINTTDDDHSYISTPDGKRAYYSSKGANTLGSTDIYVVQYKDDEDEQVPTVDLSKFALLKGWIFPAPGNNLDPNIEITITEISTNELKGQARPVERNGSFVFIIPSGSEYMVTVRGKDGVIYSEKINIPSGQKYQELSREIFLMPKSETKTVVALNDNVLGNTTKWHLQNRGDGGRIPLGSKILYIDDGGKAIDTAYVSKDGFFEFKRLLPEQNYVLKPVLANETKVDLTVTLLRADESHKKMEMTAVDGIFYEKGKEPKPTATQASKVSRSESVYYVRSEDGSAIPAGTIVQFVDVNGKVLFTEIVKSDGSFTYHKLVSGEDLKLVLVLEEDVHEKIWIEESVDGKTLRIIPHSQSTKSKINTKTSTVESTYYVRNESGNPIPAGTYVKFLDANGKVMHTELVRADGVFTFHKLPNGDDYTLELSLAKDVHEKLWIEESRDGKTVRIIPHSLSSIESKPERIEAKVSTYYVKSDEGKPIPSGTLIKFIDTEGKVVYTEIVTSDGSFAYHKLESGGDYKLELLTTIDSKQKIWIEERLEGNTVRIIPHTLITKADKMDSNKSGNEKATKMDATRESSFTFTFNYNESRNLSAETLTQLSAAIKSQIDKTGQAKLVLTASASHVPTSLPGGNESLAKQRLINGEQALMERLQLDGIDINKISTIDKKSMVSGPKNSSEHRITESQASEYQYFKVVVN